MDTKRSRVFISHSSQDKAFARVVANVLQGPEMSLWIDSEQIATGDDIIDQLGQGLQSMDLLVFLISRASLSSGWVGIEVKYAIKREIEEKRVLVLPFIIDGTHRDELPWFFANRNVSKVTPDAEGAKAVANSLRQALAQRAEGITGYPSHKQFVGDPRIDKLIKGIGVGHNAAAETAAIEILKATDKHGRNALFEALLNYQDHPDTGEVLWAALITIESCIQLAPWLIDHAILTRMGKHENFAVRSSAAVICMELAQSAPDHVPTDILIELSRYDEDWYVESAANAALKSIARFQPAVLRIFYQRLYSKEVDERAHAAYALAEIAEKEPEILDCHELERAVTILRRIKDKEALSHLEKALPKVQNAKSYFRYKYGM